MPRVPKWFGDTMETLFSSMMHPVKVCEAVMLSDTLKKVRFEGDLSRVNYVPGNVIEFRINANEYRHYTPSCFNAERGICEVLFYLHGKGPGSDWAKGLKPGDETLLMGPGGKLKYDQQSKYHVFFGDETSLGLCQSLKDAVNKNEQNYLCVLELDRGHEEWANIIGLSAEVVGKSSAEPAVEAIRELNDLNWTCWQGATFYLTGNAHSIKAFRKKLVELQIKTSQIKTEPYWIEGKKGL